MAPTREGLFVFVAVPAKPSSAAAIEPTVMAMCSHDRKVRSLAKKVLGSIRMGVVRGAVLGLEGALRELKYQSKNRPKLPPPPLPSPACRQAPQL